MFWAALIMGIAGSFHCAGMCGPILIALNAGNKGFNLFSGRVVYHGGRISMYIIMGILAGAVGKILNINGFQKQSAIVAGIVMIVLVIVIYFKPSKMQFVTIYSSGLKNIFRKYFGSKSMIALFLLGSANGLLPCGLVYMAMAGSIAAGSIVNSAIYMFLFGLGTLPMLFGISYLSSINKNISYQLSRITPVLLIAMGLILIWRGLYVDVNSCCSH